MLVTHGMEVKSRKQESIASDTVQLVSIRAIAILLSNRQSPASNIDPFSEQYFKSFQPCLATHCVA